MKKTVAEDKRPFSELLENEIKRQKMKREFRRSIFGMIKTLVVIAAAAVLVSTLLISVLKINRNSMTPTLQEGEIVVAVKRIRINKGDIIAFYYNNKLLIKRVIAKAADWVYISEDGTVEVNGEVLDEPYLLDKRLGECDIEMPYQVPDGSYFVMGDHRSVSLDSRLKEIGAVSKEQIEGKVVLRIWPIDRLKLLK